MCKKLRRRKHVTNDLPSHGHCHSILVTTQRYTKTYPCLTKMILSSLVHHHNIILRTLRFSCDYPFSPLHRLRRQSVAPHAALAQPREATSHQRKTRRLCEMLHKKCCDERDGCTIRLIYPSTATLSVCVVNNII